MVTNGRGGVGKTNIAYALAEYISRLGYKTALVDCDRSETLKRKLAERRGWHAVQEKGVTDIPFTFLQCWFEDEIKGRKKKCREKLNSTITGFEVAVVDISGELSRVQMNVAPMLDFIIMPMKPEKALVEFTLDSYHALYNALEDEEALEGKPFPKIATVRSIWKKAGKNARSCQSTIDEEVKEYGYLVLDTILSPFDAYNKAAHFGVSVLDATEVGDLVDRRQAEKPAYEMGRLCKEVLVLAGLASPKMKRINPDPTVSTEGML
tara:strand:+ start:6227 stop:7021 length:795 start_codon:yes stop_codon:yes gene_type:complete